MSDRVQQMISDFRQELLYYIEARLSAFGDALSVELSGNSRAPSAQNQPAHIVARGPNEVQSAHRLAQPAQDSAQSQSAHRLAQPVGRYVGRKEEESSNLPTSEEVFEQAKRAYRRRVGKTFGSLYRDIAGQWAGLVARHGGEVIVRAVELWASELDRDYARSLRIPVAAFLKTSGEYIEQAEESENAAAAPAPVTATEVESVVGPGFRRPSRQV